MKRRLFWKIVVAFWLTFLAITQGVWLLFETNRDKRPPPEVAMTETVGPALVSAGAAMVERSGPRGFQAFAEKLPPVQRERLALAPAMEASRQPGAIVQQVTGADGQRYVLRYRPLHPEGAGFRLNVPPEMLLLGLIGGLVFSAALAWYLTDPINRLRMSFDRLARGDFTIRLGPVMGERRDEIADLARDFDRMAQRLEELVSARDRLLHDVSHELRSPLARLQLAVGLARQVPDRIETSLERIERETARLDALVGELLTLTRLEHAGMTAEDYFDLADIICSIIDDARFEARASGVHIDLDERLPEQHFRPVMRGSAALVHRAIDNVVRNALRFSPPDKTVSIRVRFDSAHSAYVLDIIDEGPGIDASLGSAMFEPFVRGEAADQGFGLGLAIASRAIKAHDGSIVARNRPGGGLEVTIVLPAAGTQPI